MAYLVNKVLPVIKNGKEYNQEVPAHLAVTLYDILDLKSNIKQFLGEDPVKLEAEISFLVGRHWFNMWSKVENFITLYLDDDQREVALERLRKPGFDRDMFNDFTSALLPIKMKDIECALKTYRNIGRKIAQQVDNIFLEYASRHMQPWQEITLNFMGGKTFTNAYFTKMTEKGSCIDWFLYLYSRDNKSPENYGDRERVKKWELLSAFEENGLLEDEMINELEKNGFVYRSNKESKEFIYNYNSLYDEGSPYQEAVNFTYWLDLNFNNTFSFYSEKSSFEEDLMNFVGTNNLFEALFLFYVVYFMDYVRLYNTCRTKLSYIKNNFYESMYEHMFENCFQFWTYKDVTTETYEIAPVNNRWVSILDFLAVSNPYCSLNSLKHIMTTNYLGGSVEYVYTNELHTKLEE